MYVTDVRNDGVHERTFIQVKTPEFPLLLLETQYLFSVQTDTCFEVSRRTPRHVGEQRDEEVSDLLDIYEELPAKQTWKEYMKAVFDRANTQRGNPPLRTEC